MAGAGPSQSRQSGRTRASSTASRRQPQLCRTEKCHRYVHAGRAMLRREEMIPDGSSRPDSGKEGGRGTHLQAEFTHAKLHRLRASRCAEMIGRTSSGSKFQSAVRLRSSQLSLCFGSGNSGCTMIARDVDLASEAMTAAKPCCQLIGGQLYVAASCHSSFVPAPVEILQYPAAVFGHTSSSP